MEERQKFVMPGDRLCDRQGKKIGGGVYLEDDTIFSSVMGRPKITPDEVYVLPFSGVYMPRAGDMVVGKIVSVEVSGWFVDINSPYQAFLPLAEAVEEYIDTSRVEMSRYFGIDDLIYCVVSRVTNEKNVRVSMADRAARKIEGGVALPVTPTKVPRIIGKAASMIKLIRDKTGCRMLVGQNGVVWIDGQNKAKAIEAILAIEREGHMEGLTEKIERMLG